VNDWHLITGHVFVKQLAAMVKWRVLDHLTDSSDLCQVVITIQFRSAEDRIRGFLVDAPCNMAVGYQRFGGP
jgi:hypothetical protein